MDKMQLTKDLYICTCLLESRISNELYNQMLETGKHIAAKLQDMEKADGAFSIGDVAESIVASYAVKQ